MPNESTHAGPRTTAFTTALNRRWVAGLVRSGHHSPRGEASGLRRAAGQQLLAVSVHPARL